MTTSRPISAADRARLIELATSTSPPENYWQLTEKEQNNWHEDRDTYRDAAIKAIPAYEALVVELEAKLAEAEERYVALRSLGPLSTANDGDPTVPTKIAEVLGVPIIQARTIDALKASEARATALLEATNELCSQIEATEEHGAGADDSDCPICNAIRKLRALTPEARQNDGESHE